MHIGRVAHATLGSMILLQRRDKFVFAWIHVGPRSCEINGTSAQHAYHAIVVASNMQSVFRLGANGKLALPR